MKNRQIRAVVITAGVLALLVTGSAIANAAGTGTASTTQATAQAADQGQGHRPPGGPGRPGGQPPFIKAAASYLGVTPKALMKQLKGGSTTLAKIAEAKGKSVDGLKEAIIDDARTHLAEQVADGDLTQEQADERLDHLTDEIDDIVTKPLRRGGGGCGAPGAPPAAPDGPPADTGTNA